MDINYQLNSESNIPKFSNPEQLSDYMWDFGYSKFTTLMSPEDVLITRHGSCHDQAFLALTELDAMGLFPKAKFIMAVDKDGVGGETHTFVYWVDNNATYWFENTWEDYQGINEFESEQEMLDCIIEAFKLRNPRQYIYLASFDPDYHQIGEDLETFVDICMTDAKLV